MNKIIAVLSLLLALCVCITTVTGAKEDTTEWGNEDAVYVEIKPEAIGNVMGDISDTFSELNLKAVYIVSKYEEKYLRLLLILNEGGTTQQDAAITVLKSDPRVRRAYNCDDVPFETVLMK